MDRPAAWLVVIAGLVYMFLLGPLVIVAVAAFGASELLQFPPEAFSLRWLINVFTVSAFLRSFEVSLEIALAGTTAAMLVGLPAAYALSRLAPPGAAFLRQLFVLPILVPGVAFGFATLNLLSVKLGWGVMASLLAGHVIIVLPYAVRVISSCLANLDPAIEEAAISLGASRAKTFFVIVLPNIKSGLLAAFILAFVTSLNNVPMSLFLTGPGISTLPIQMLSYVEYYFDPTVAALSVLLMLMTVLVMLSVERTLGLGYFARRA